MKMCSRRCLITILLPTLQVRYRLVMYQYICIACITFNFTVGSEETSGQSAEMPGQLTEKTPNQLVEETPDQLVEETSDRLVPNTMSHKPRDIVFIDILIGIVLAIVITLIVKKFM